MYDILEIIYVDEELYENKLYFSGITVDEYGIVRVSTVESPLDAKRFVIAETSNKASVYNIVSTVLKDCKIYFKKLNYTVV